MILDTNYLRNFLPLDRQKSTLYVSPVDLGRAPLHYYPDERARDPHEQMIGVYHLFRDLTLTTFNK